MARLMPSWRSLLFVPADDDRRCAKARDIGADAVILDLEDGVAAARKEIARQRIGDTAAMLSKAEVGVVVRINAPWRAALTDLDVAVVAGADAVMVPKVEDAARLCVLGEMLAELESAHGRGVGTTEMLVLIESPAGLAAASELAAAPRVIGLALGTEDFCVELGVTPERDALELPSRQIALAAAVRGQMALAVPFSIARFRDTEAYTAAARASAAWGANGAICVHPSQVGIANECFGVDEAALARAQRILDAWEAREGDTAVVSLDGRMIDLPVVEQARRLLARRRASRRA